MTTAGLSGNIENKYIGCYYDDVNDESQSQKRILQNNTTLTIEWCIGQCLQESPTYTYAGLEVIMFVPCQTRQTF